MEVRLRSRDGRLSFPRSRRDSVALIEPVDLWQLLRRDGVARACSHGPKLRFVSAGAADTGRHLVADQLAAAVDEERQTAHPTCALLLVAVGRGAPNAAVLCRHAAEDRAVAVANGIGGARNVAEFGDEIGRQTDTCQRTRSEGRQLQVSYVNARQIWPIAARWKALWIRNPARTSRLQAPWCWCHCESEFKMEIPVYSKKEIPVQNGSRRE